MNTKSKIVRVWQVVSILILLMQGPLLATDVQVAKAKVLEVPIDSIVLLEMLKSFYGVSAEDASVQSIQSTESSLFGLFIIPASEGADTGPSAHYFIATEENGQITITPEYSDTFTEQMQALSKVDAANQELPNLVSMLTSGNGSSQLSFPWLTNTNATYTNGPHADGFQPAPSILSALDFVPSDNKVRAERDGFAQQIICSGRTASSWILVNHTDGWRTSYYHVVNAQVSTAGRQVARGEYLGDLAMTSADALRCGGSWTGPHVHTALLQNGAQVSVQGVDIGGWTVGGSGLGGTLTRVSDGAVRYASSANGNRTVYNDGTIGSGTFLCNNPSPNSDQIGLYTDDDYCGTPKILGVGEYPNPGALGIANDSISSIKVGSNVTATLCRDDNYFGGCEDFTRDDPHLGDNSIGNDSVSSAKVVTRPVLPPSDYGFCAEEGQRCSFSGTAQIYFGANNQFVGPRTYTDGVDCNNNVFGDPIPGTHKQCFIKGGRPEGSTFCANESGTCSFGSGSVATVYYGVSGKYYNKTGVVSSIACDNNTFGDPFLGQGKSCYYIITGTSATPPSMPTNFRVTGSTQTSITIAWDDVSNETGYKIYEWNGSTFVYLDTVGTNVTSYTHNKSAYGWDQFYEVSAYNGIGESAHAGWIHGYTLPGPFNKITPPNGSINQPTNPTLTWGASAGATSYEYCYDITNDNACSNWPSNGTATSATLSGLSPSTAYYWQVRALNSAGTTYADGSNVAFWSFTTRSNTVSCPTITNWKGEYWTNPSLTGTPTVCRDDTDVNFDWAYDSPDPLIPADGFSARWTRTVYFPAGAYRFYLGHDDGASLFIDDMINPVLNKWTTCCVVDPLDKVMTEGNHVIKIEYFENGGAANVHTWWERVPDPTNTGILNPSFNMAQAFGDKNGYEVNPTNAYADDSVFAMDVNSGTGTSASYTDKKKDRHLFYNYGISLPSNATIQGIEILLDAKVDNTTGTPKLYIQLSWNGGATWTTAKSTSTLGTSEQRYVLGGSADTWGHAWTAADLSNANFRVRIIDVASDTSRDFSLDSISVRVTYK